MRVHYNCLRGYVCAAVCVGARVCFVPRGGSNCSFFCLKTSFTPIPAWNHLFLSHVAFKKLARFTKTGSGPTKHTGEALIERLEAEGVLVIEGFVDLRVTLHKHTTTTTHTHQRRLAA